MTEEAVRLIQEVAQASAQVERAQLELRQKQYALDQFQKRCSHDWSEEYDPIHHPGGSDPGDPPGTMGVDRRGPTSWPARTEPRWKRTCRHCGKVEHTTRQAEVVTRRPQW